VSKAREARRTRLMKKGEVANLKHKSMLGQQFRVNLKRIRRIATCFWQEEWKPRRPISMAAF